MMTRNRSMLIILDGWGYAPAWGGNAVELAETPNIDTYWRKYPHQILKAAEESVGLPRHEPGNSEVGHLNLGSGQIVRQNLPGISKIIEDGSFFKNQIMLDAIQNAKNNNSNIHIMGLLSDGGVHSHIDQLFAILDLIKSKITESMQNKIFLHIFTDGRDTDQMKALSFASELSDKISELGFGKIESVSGRYFAMDRDNRWDRVGKVYDMLSSGIGTKSDSIDKAISENYRQGRYDEFIEPTIIEKEDAPFVPISDNDTIIFFNFRADRARELTWAFVMKDFSEFARKKVLKNLYFASFAFHEEYENKLPIKVVFRPINVADPVANIISKSSLNQFHIAETEKYAHITYFFNGGHEAAYPREERILIPSPKVATYDLKPEMSAIEVKDNILKSIGNFDFIVSNFANPDMVGHTGNLKATTKACETVDKCLGPIVEEGLKKDYIVMITADHGNAEQMINPNTGEPHTEHTTSPVPFIFISNRSEYQNPLLDHGNDNILACVSPTILKAMGLEIPKEMTGKPLIN